VCTYVKSDIGMMAKGNIAPNGKKYPDPDVLLLSYTGCLWRDKQGGSGASNRMRGFHRACDGGRA
jgi:hypothetical protein